VDLDTPLVDARLPDGSRVNAVIPPVSIDGPSITIRKFGTKKLTVEDLVTFGSMTPQIAEFLKACVISRLNVVVSGGTGSGKTTLLNVLSGFIPEDERIVTIEDAAELQLNQEHVVRLEAKKPNLDGKGEVTIRDLVKNSLRMRPERIVVGECRGGEALDMLQAMNTGHDGSLTTLHANAPRDAISRMETMSLMAGLDFPLKVIREQIASAVELIVQQTRLRDGSRKITQITEVAGMEGDTVVLQDIFKFSEEGLDKDGRVIGQIRPTGLRPLFTPKLEAAGFKLPPEIFMAGGVRDSLRGRR
jgi:pilus assembly protein CpaF